LERRLYGKRLREEAIGTSQSSPGVGIVGAGAVACGTAALLERSGHRTAIWSPKGNSAASLGAPLLASGAVEGHFQPLWASSVEELAAFAGVLIFALPAYGHKQVMDAVAPHLRPEQTVLISSHASFGALYLSRLLAARDLVLPIVAWGTTAVTARLSAPARVSVNSIRSRIDICTIPLRLAADGLATCRRLFGDRFVEREGLIAITLSNLNPQSHLGIALCNMTRMELGETWDQGVNVTPNVGRLLEALDKERLAIAGALGLPVRTIFEHFHLSFQIGLDSVSAMNQKMHRQGRGGTGPTTANSRYVTEDVPYGLVTTVKLGELCGRPATLHQAGISIFSALYGRDFFAENTLLYALDFGSMTFAELQALSRDGFWQAAGSENRQIAERRASITTNLDI
jgi:opine dehydrogenase